LNITLIVLVIVSLPAMASSVGNAIRSSEVSPLVWVYPVVYLLVTGRGFDFIYANYEQQNESLKSA
jgi:hypothetical protein